MLGNKQTNYLVLLPLRYESDPWLCNLDWSAKKFRGKAKTAAAMKQLLKRIENHYERKYEVFRAGPSTTEAFRAGPSTEDPEEENVCFLITTEEPSLPKRPVHMPGYPE